MKKQQERKASTNRARHFTEAEINFFLSHYRYDPMTGAIFLLSGKKMVRNYRYQYFYVSTPIGMVLAHRLAWILYYHQQPKFTIDHINGNKYDNRIKNLRDVPFLENCKNRRRKVKTCFRHINAINEECVFSTSSVNYIVTRKFNNIDDAVIFRLRHGLDI